jgi:hypothetical protein
VKHNGETYRDEAGRARPLVPGVILPHPFLRRNQFLLNGASRDRYRYRFLRVTRLSDGARPYGGRILVENVGTCERREFYAHVFDVKWSN